MATAKKTPTVASAASEVAFYARALKATHRTSCPDDGRPPP
jgi:hypothetical protein